MRNLTILCRTALLTVALMLQAGIAQAQQEQRNDTYEASRPDSLPFARRFIHRLGAEGRMGYIFPTSTALRGDGWVYKSIRSVQSYHLRYTFQVRPNSMADRAYIGAYQGFGIGYFHFVNGQQLDVPSPTRLGRPVALYLLQGGRLATLSGRLSLNYEWNFGASFGWKAYDEVKNPGNNIVGSPVNAYLNAGLYLRWALSKQWDLTMGATATHFSNGNTRYPNSGLNMVDGKIGLAYRLYGATDEADKPASHSPLPPFPRHVSYDLALFGSWRRKAVSVYEGQLPAPGSYPVFGFNFAPMYNLGYKFRAGLSLDGVYDGSANVTIDDNNDFRKPSAGRQLSLGLSARGEFVMPYFTINVGFGANVLHGGGDLSSFYQIVALKIEMPRNSYLHIGYNLRDLHEPNYLMLGIGYRFNNKRPKLF